MNTIHDVLTACKRVKESGTSSKVPVPISMLEKLCRDALMWQHAPPMMRDAIKSMEGGK